jgi:hypothetical protein
MRVDFILFTAHVVGCVRWHGAILGNDAVDHLFRKEVIMSLEKDGHTLFAFVAIILKTGISQFSIRLWMIQRQRMPALKN